MPDNDKKIICIYHISGAERSGSYTLAIFSYTAYRYPMTVLSMENEYEMTVYESLGIGFVMVRGAVFCHIDLFELVGKEEYMTTFNLKKYSVTFEKYGESITGTIFYSLKDRSAFESGSEEYSAGSHIKLLEYGRGLSSKDKEELKYGGFPIQDIDFITFTPWKNEIERYSTGEKVVPNIIEIPLKNTALLDANRIYQSYIVDKINSGTKLIPFEIEEFIGVTLGINHGHIDSLIIKHLGYDVDKIQKSHNIYYHYYKVLEKKNLLTSKQKQFQKDIKLSRYVTRLQKLIKEFEKGGVIFKEIKQPVDFWKELNEHIIKFEPAILLHGKKQIWWDFDSYIHILLRHVRKWQVSKFISKTSFLYKFSDLSRMIEKILREVEEEIQSHYSNFPNKEFKRVGSMSVLFNSDYYHVQIDCDGRLVNLYMVGSIEFDD